MPKSTQRAKRLRVCLLHNIVAPYRLPVFEEINQSVNLEVWFCKTKTRDRLWDTNLNGYSFRHAILPVWQLGPFFFNFTIAWRLLRHRFDVYLVGDFPETAFATFVTIIIAKLRRRPVVLWSETVDHDVNYFQHLTVSSKPYHQWLRRAFTSLITGYRRLLHKLPDRYVALSSLAHRFLVSEGVNPSRIDSGIQVMPASLLPAPTITKTQSPYAGKTVILYLGYLNPSKGVDLLIQSFKALPDPLLRLVIVGTGPHEGQLHELAKRDSRIEFTGYRDGPGRANYYHWADIFVLPTLVDCWAMVVNEALHYGIPVITTSVAGAAELLGEEESGLTIPPRDPQALTQALQRLIGDPNLRSHMSATARTRRDITDSRVGAQPITAALLKAGGQA